MVDAGMNIDSGQRKQKNNMDDFPFLDPKKFSFDCVYPKCEKTFELTNDLYDHIREHSRVLKCPICALKYKCMASLVYHVRTHSHDKPYICPLPNCSFVTATKGNLKAHLLSNHHKDTMTLKLLNCILAMDTEHSRPEMHLHGPRERKKRKLEHRMSSYGKMFTFRSPKMSQKVSPSNQNETQLHKAFIISPSNGQQQTLSMQQMMAQRIQIPVATPVYGTGSFYKNFQSVNSSTKKQQQQLQFVQPVSVPGPFSIPLIQQRNRMSDQLIIDMDNQEVMLKETSNDSQRIFEEKQSGYCDEENEDFTIRIKSYLLKSIEEAQKYRNINDVTDGDKFLQAIDGVKSTRDFYAKSSFMNFKSESDSMTPMLVDEDDDVMMPKIEMSDSGSTSISDLYAIAPPIVF